MEASSISRFNSQSSNRSYGGSNKGNVSPILSPSDFADGPAQFPFLQTWDKREWIDLNALSPKLVEDLRRHYDPSISNEASSLLQREPSISNEPSGPIGKGAAKLKAFVRQTKRGVEIRLRRKVNADQDEITEISLIPDPAFQASDLGDVKTGFTAELPTAQNEISELPDSSVRQELDSTEAPSRLSIGSSIISEPLPRYESRNEVQGSSASKIDNESNARSIEQVLETPIFPTAGQFDASIVPRDELFLPNSEQKFEQSSSDENTEVNVRKQSLGEPERMGNEETRISDRLQEIIATLESSTVSDDQESTIAKANGKDGRKFGPFLVAKKKVYETETDAEPPSPIRRRAVKPKGKAVMAFSPKRKKSHTKATRRKLSGIGISNDSEEEAEPTTLLRKQTIPKRLPASSGAELLWSSLLQTQAKLLGAEHPLVYKAKSDFAHSRANSHSQEFNDLSSLTKSKSIAAENLGLVHPWVAAFAEELETLKSLIKNNAFLAAGYLSKQERTTMYEAGYVGVGSQSSTLERDMEQRATILNDDMVETSAMSKQDASESYKTRRAIDSDAMPTSGSEPLSESTRPLLPTITTSLPAEPETSSAQQSAAGTAHLESIWNTTRPTHQNRSDRVSLPILAFDALLKNAVDAMHWLQRNYGPEPPVAPGKVRVRWTCPCGEQLYDDFVEKRRGAARELEAYLNRPKYRAAPSGESPVSPSGSSGFHSHGNSSVGWPPSYQTSWSSYGASGQGTTGGNGDSKLLQATGTLPLHSPYGAYHEPPWLLTCVNEDRYTPKMDHINMAPHRIMSDRDLAEALREHYFNVNKRWWRKLRIRGLVSIEFVQLEVHQNRFADIRKSPDMPDTSREDYTFDPVDLLPPVGSQYLVHLFKHPRDYDRELITYLRAPKKKGHLPIGVGWGINLVEGFLAHRVWMCVSGFFALGSLAFLIAWELKKRNVQGASGVAAWIVSVGVLAMGWVQASLG